MKNDEQKTWNETFEEIIKSIPVYRENLMPPAPKYNYFIEPRDNTIRYGRPATHFKTRIFDSYEEALEELNSIYSN